MNWWWWGVGTTTMIETMMHDPAHPGIILRGWIGELGIGIGQLAEHIGVGCDSLTSILLGKYPINADVDSRLHDALGSSLGYWQRMQNAYDTWEAKSNADTRLKITRLNGFYEWKPHTGDVAALSLNPWDWVALSFEDAMIHTVNAERCATTDNDKFHPLYQYAAAQTCCKERPQIETGDGVALLNSICRCFEHGLSVPDWLSNQLI